MHSREQQAVAAIRAVIIGGLEKSCGAKFSLESLSQAVTFAQDWLVTQCALVAASQVADRYHLLGGTSNFMFDSAGGTFEVSAVIDKARSEFVLSVVPGPGVSMDTTPTRRTRSADSYGRFKRIVVVVPSGMRDYSSFLADLMQDLVESGFGWIAGQIALVSMSEQVEVARGLYSEVRRIIPEPQLHRDVWLGMLGQALGFRLVDPLVVRSAVADMQPSGSDSLRLVAELLQTRLPRQGLLMNSVLASDRYMEVDLRDAQYMKDGSVYAVALMALYGGTRLAMLPVYKSDRQNVLLLFPADRPALKDRLRGARKELHLACVSHLSELDRALDLCEVVVGSGVVTPPAALAVPPGLGRATTWTTKKAGGVAELLFRAGDVTY